MAVGHERYAIPQVNLIELLRADGQDGAGTVSRVYDAPVYRYRDTLLPLVFLHDILGVGAPGPAPASPVAPFSASSPVSMSSPISTSASLHIVVLHADGVTFGLVVDEILASQEIVVKPLAEGLRQAAVFSGATILGDGRVALILDIPGVITRFQAPEERGLAKPQAA